MELSIIILTMNRQDQLIEALDSCLACALPLNTEIVVINNGSTDDTKNILKSYSDKCDVSLITRNLDKNMGVGEGRNIGVDIASGDYLFFLDDDAVIDVKYNRNIFVDAIGILKSNKKIATLTTEIYDEGLSTIRQVNFSKYNKLNELYSILMVHGGGFFMRHDILDSHPFPNIYYGFEDLYPSIRFIDMGFVNAYSQKLRVTHRPKVNKWSSDYINYEEQKSKAIAGLLTVKHQLYPLAFSPLILFGFLYRCLKHFGFNFSSMKKSYITFKKQNVDSKRNKIKYRTVFKLFKDFGIGAGL